MVAALFALTLLWLVLRISVANALLDQRPDLAATLAPRLPNPTLAGLDPTQGAAGSETAVAMLARAPLAEQPLLLAAQQAIEQGDTQRADILLAEAIRRNPRSRFGLLLRLDQQLRRNQPEDAAVTVALLSRLLPDAGPFLVNELARMARTPEVRGALAGVLAGDRRLRTELLEALARQGAEPDAILGLAGRVAPAPVGQTPRWQAIMLDEMVTRGEIARARQVWNDLAGTERTPEGIYDSDFAGLPGPPPFNWRFEASSSGFAEPAAGGSLYVEFYGRENAVLGEQLLTLSPGEYRLAFEAEGSADGEGGQLAWTIECQAGRRALATAPVAGLETAAKAFSQSFVVPRDCPAQWLRLTGKFGEFPKDQRATFSDIGIVGARQ